MNKQGGSELHRLKTMDNYDERLFNKLYKKLKPLIKKLSRNVDARRYNVSQDIIESYFWDKFIYVFHKYQADYEEQRLQATLISSLTTFKNRLLRKAYGEQSDYYQSLVSLDELYDDSKGDIADADIARDVAREKLEAVFSFMKSRLSPDAYLLFEVQLDPPAYIRSLLKSDNSKISIIMLLDFFDMPRTKTNSNYISMLRKEIKEAEKKAGEELK